MSFITQEPEEKLPVVVNSTNSNLAPGNYELTSNATYSLTLDPLASLGSEWTFTCADKTVESNNVTILGGSQITWTLPDGTTSATNQDLVLDTGGVLVIIRKLDSTENYKLTVLGQPVNYEVLPPF